MFTVSQIIQQGTDVEEQIREISGCADIAVAEITTSTNKTIYVTDNGRCFTYGRFQNKLSLTEAKTYNKYGRLVFKFNKGTTRYLYGGGELVYCSFHGIDYEEMERVSFRDGNPMNISLYNLYKEEDKIERSESMEKYAGCYAKKHKELSKSLWFTFNQKIDYEWCRDIVSSQFFYLCRKFDKEPQRNAVDFVAVWYYWCKKYSVKMIPRLERMCEFDEETTRVNIQDHSKWEVHRLINQYLHNPKHKDIARKLSDGYINKDISDDYGMTMEQANTQRQKIIGNLRLKLKKEIVL